MLMKEAILRNAPTRPLKKMKKMICLALNEAIMIPSFICTMYSYARLTALMLVHAGIQNAVPMPIQRSPKTEYSSRGNVTLC